MQVFEKGWAAKSASHHQSFNRYSANLCPDGLSTYFGLPFCRKPAGDYLRHFRVCDALKCVLSEFGLKGWTSIEQRLKVLGALAEAYLSLRGEAIIDPCTVFRRTLRQSGLSCSGGISRS